MQIDFDWRTLPVTMRLEMFDEYFMLNTYISFWKNPRPNTVRYQSLFCEGGEFFTKVRDALAYVCTLIEQRYDDERHHPHKRQDRRKATEELLRNNYSAILYTDVWTELSAELLRRSLPNHCEEKLGTVFSDFRGLLLRFVGKASSHARNVTSTFKQAPHIVKPCEDTTQSHSIGSIGYPFEPTGRDALCWAEAMLPVLLSQESPAELYQNRADTIEYTFSMASQQRCLFGTGFGNQGRVAEKGSRLDPITYIVLSAHDDHRGIGRFINRLHTLGGLRLASLRSLSAMRDCGDDLSRLRSHIIEIEDSITSLEERRDADHDKSQDAGRDGQFDRKNAAERKRTETVELKPHVKQQNERLRQITDELRVVRTELARLDGAVDGGITYRSLRSKHYRNRFTELVKAMDFCRLSGYQPYDQFVRHRLGRAFDMIEEVGVRYRQVFDMEIRARKLLMLYHSDENQSSIRHITDVIGDLQFWGEVMLLYIILPHYTSGLLAEIIPFDNKGTLSLTAVAITKHHITFTVWAFFILFATSRYWKKILLTIRRERREIVKGLGVILVMLVIAFVLAVQLYSAHS